jgi:hypothetical protein
MVKSLKELALLPLLAAAIARPAWGQEPVRPPEPTAEPGREEDDLELPSQPKSPTSSAPTSSTPSAAGAPVPQPSAPVAPDSAPGARESAPSAPPPPGSSSTGSADTAGTLAPTAGASATSPASASPDRVRPVVPSWSDGLRLGGYSQAQFETSQLSEDQLQQGGAPLNQNRFLVRRARLRLDRDWEFARGSLELDANTARGITFGIRRAEAAVLYRGSEPKGSPLVMLTAGIIDIPFGYELLESTRERPFMERSTGGLALFPTDMDAGVRLSGSLGFFRYAVAILNGEPLDGSAFPRDPNSAKDVTGRVGVDVTPAESFSLGAGTSFATGKGFHPGQDAGKNQLVWRDTDQNGVFSSTEVVLVPASGATPSKNFERWALGLDLEASLQTSLGRSKVYVEGFVAKNYDRGLLPADPVVTGVDVREAGAYGALLQDVTRYGIVGFRGGFYDPNADVAETRSGQLLPLSQTVWTLSPLAGLVLKGSAKLLFQYDFVLDKLGRDGRGVPADAKNNGATVRLQVEL